MLDDVTGTEGPALSALALDTFSATRVQVRCSRASDTLLELEADAVELEALLAFENAVGGADPALLGLDGSTHAVSYSTLVGDGDGTGVRLAAGALTLAATALDAFDVGVEGVGSVSVDGTYNLSAATAAGGGAVQSTEVLGSGSIEADPVWFSYVADGDCTGDKLAPDADSPMVDAGPPGGVDPDGTDADIGATGGPEGWTLVADADGDGSSEVFDCDDADTGIHPGATDTPGDGIDQDCDGSDAEVAADTGDPPSDVVASGRLVPRTCGVRGSSGIPPWIVLALSGTLAWMAGRRKRC